MWTCIWELGPHKGLLFLCLFQLVNFPIYFRKFASTKGLIKFWWCFLWIALRLWPITGLQYFINLTMMQYWLLFFAFFPYLISKNIYKDPARVKVYIDLAWSDFLFNFFFASIFYLIATTSIKYFTSCIFLIIWEHWHSALANHNKYMSRPYFTSKTTENWACFGLLIN